MKFEVDEKWQFEVDKKAEIWKQTKKRKFEVDEKKAEIDIDKKQKFEVVKNES